MGDDGRQLLEAEFRSLLSEHPVRATRRNRRWWIALITAAIVIVVDQITKSIALDHLGQSHVHAFGPFGFELAYNTGSAFSLFQGTTWPLFVLDVAMVGVLIFFALRASSILMLVGLGLIMGGAIGNMADRIVRHHDGGVIDFITLSHWPTFNGADSAITIGAILVVVALLRDSASTKAGETPEGK